MYRLDKHKTSQVFTLFMVVFISISTNSSSGYLLTSSFTDVNGLTTSLSVYEGKLLFVEAFATDCSWCQKEHSELEKLHQEYLNDIYMVSISIKTDAQSKMSLSEYLEKFPTSWAIGFDDGFEFTQLFNIKSTPTMILFNQEGRLLAQKVGYVEYSELSSIVSQYLSISNPQQSDNIVGYDSGDNSGSLIEDLFGSTLFRVAFSSLLVIMVYIKMTSSKSV